MQPAPQYVLGTSKARYMLPKLLLDFFLLAIVAVLGILVIKMLRIRIDTTLYVILGAILAIIFAIDIVSSYIHSSQIRYNFYWDRIDKIEKKVKTIMFNEVSDIIVKENLFDKICKTKTIILGPNFRICGAEKTEQLIAYIQGLVQNAKYQAQYQQDYASGSQAARYYASKQ